MKVSNPPYYVLEILIVLGNKLFYSILQKVIDPNEVVRRFTTLKFKGVGYTQYKE